LASARQPPRLRQHLVTSLNHTDDRYIDLQLRYSLPTRRSSDLTAQNKNSVGGLGIHGSQKSRGRAQSRQKPRRSSSQLANRSLRSEEHTSELQSRENLVCRQLLTKKNASNYVNHMQRRIPRNL